MSSVGAPAKPPAKPPPSPPPVLHLLAPRAVSVTPVMSSAAPTVFPILSVAVSTLVTTTKRIQSFTPHAENAAAVAPTAQ